MAKKQRIDKILSNLGYGSRSEIKKYCKQGSVVVNGSEVSNPGTQVDTENDEILFNGEEVIYREYIYLMMNKPDGYISQLQINMTQQY
ncbi:S4 domain protein [Clostridioides difficile DA00149]|nr:S4 domain protein [Clostridioides difficile DA00149]EQG63824.1 S4 domain protein [Clostridioides difficile DA00149]